MFCLDSPSTRAVISMNASYAAAARWRVAFFSKGRSGLISLSDILTIASFSRMTFSTSSISSSSGEVRIEKSKWIENR